MKVIIDTREKNPFLLEFYGYEIIHKKLDTGDYSVLGFEDFISIDRKASVSELVSNLFYQWKRFKKEMERASKITRFFLVLEFPKFLIESFPCGSGIPKKKWPYLHATSELIFKRLIGIYEQYGVKTVFCDNRADAEQCVVDILQSVIDGKEIKVKAFNE